VEGFVAKMAKERGISPSEAEADFLKNIRPTSLIKRFATTDEVAAMVVYLSSPIASATNGAALRADGGVVQSVV
jgi:NAD(P)-dependent dehydrogenase (short-subunit alcohol dehydrogenase family)